MREKNIQDLLRGRGGDFSEELRWPCGVFIWVFRFSSMWLWDCQAKEFGGHKSGCGLLGQLASLSF